MQWRKARIFARMKGILRTVVGQYREAKRGLTLNCITGYHRMRGQHVKHLVISGCPRSGSTLLYNMIRSSSASLIYAPERELSASDTLDVRATQIVTKRPLDVLKLAEIDRELGKAREVMHIVLVRDPRDLVSSKHDSAPNQFFQGYDYQLFVRPGFKAFSAPGIGAVAEAIDRAEETVRRLLIVKYEDLIKNPEQVRKVIAFATGMTLPRPFASFHETQIPPGLSGQLNGVRPINVPVQPAWTAEPRFGRALKQIELFPELEALATRWGYPPTEDLLRQYGSSMPQAKTDTGTVVAFHTSDEFYTQEAERCRTRLQQLGLRYDFTTVTRNGSWVENCALKPEYLLDVRKRIRGPLLYVDVDAFVHKDPWPYLSLYDGDMAAYIHSDGTLCSGSILLNDTEAVVAILNEWVARQKKAPQTYDQEVLQEIIEEDEAIDGEEYRFQRLPPNFVFISDRKYPYLYGNPIIEHLQASRVSKRGTRGDWMTQRISELESIVD